MSYEAILGLLARVQSLLHSARGVTLTDDQHSLLLVKVYRDLLAATAEARGFLRQVDPKDRISAFIHNHTLVTGKGPSDDDIYDFIRKELST